MTEVAWPAGPGTYLLIFEAREQLELRAGRRNSFVLSPDYYVYVGSAHGPGGLAARLGRHLRPDRRPHWHVDALTAILPPCGIVATTSPGRLECAWVRRLLALPGASTAIPHFGSSDCREGCPAHLVRLPATCAREPWIFHCLSERSDEAWPTLTWSRR